ncbi:MAG: VWA domain-containing protein, partial [Nitrospirae bacterium]
MHLAQPLWLLLLPAAVAAAVAAARGARRRRGLPVAGLELARASLPATGRSRARAALPWLRLAAAACLALALARPQTVATVERVAASGIDIVLALDVSGSMRAEDFQPENRLQVAKRVLRDFVRGRRSDRIGLVVFAGESFTQCPLTLDYDLLEALLAQVDFGLLPEGTAIGSAIANGVNRLADSRARSRILV